MDHKAAKADKPFFLYLALTAPHACVSVPACAYPAGKGKNGGLQWVKTDTVEACNTATQELATAAGVTGTYGANTYIHPDNSGFSTTVAQCHSTMIRRVDDFMADLIQTLKDLGIDDNTLIVFTSDNGPHAESGSGNFKNGTQDPKFFKSYGMMDGIKRDCWDGGLRVPTLVRWPGKVASQISLNACQFHDWMATFADAAGVPVPARCDGVSLLPTLVGVPERQKESTIYSEYTYNGSTPSYSDFLSSHRGKSQNLQQVVYVDGYKGIRRNGEQDFEIYNTETDPQESNNLASSLPNIQTKLQAKANRIRRGHPGQNTGLTGTIAAVTAPANLRSGMKWRCWQNEFDWVPDFRQLTAAPNGSGISSTPTPSVAGSGSKGVEFTGYLKVDTTGEYKFYVTTDANTGSKAFIRLHEMNLVDADSAYEAGTEANSFDRQGDTVVNPNAVQTVKLEAGYHPIRIGYVGKTGAGSLSLSWECTDAAIAKQAIPAANFSYEYVNPLNLDKTAEDLPYTASSTTLLVQTQLSWTAESDQAWLTVTPTAGTGTATLNIQAAANAAQTERTAIVTVNCDGVARTFTVTQAPAPVKTGYDKWKEKHFPADADEAVTAPTATPAGDKVVNLMKYATATDPNTPCGSITQLGVYERSGKQFLKMTWPVNPEATDITFAVECSTDLQTWSPATGALSIKDNNGTYEDDVPMEAGSPERRFLRLKVTRATEE